MLARMQRALATWACNMAAEGGGVQVYTVDHEDGGRLRLDVEFAWSSCEDPVPVTPDMEIVCDVSAGYVCAQDACSVLWQDGIKWFTISEGALLALHDGLLLEYDMRTFAPIGEFCGWVRAAMQFVVCGGCRSLSNQSSASRPITAQLHNRRSI